MRPAQLGVAPAVRGCFLPATGSVTGCRVLLHLSYKVAAMARTPGGSPAPGPTERRICQNVQEPAGAFA